MTDRSDDSRHLDAPLRIDGRGHAAVTDHDDHVRDLIRAVLFTEPGERVNLPEFGCALKTLVFMPNRDVLAPALRTLVQGALQRWLAGVIVAEDVQVESVESELRVHVIYRRILDGTRRVATFGAPPGAVP
jgi:uncharacterized protein